MDSLANYGSDGENSNNSDDAKMSSEEKSHNNRHKRASDVNYDPVQMDMSEESNNNHTSDETDSDEGTHSPALSRPLASSKLDSTHSRTPPSDQRRLDHDSHKSSYRGDSKRSSDSRSDRTRNSEERCRRPSDDKRSRDVEHKESRRSRDDDRKHRDDDRRRDKNSSSSSSTRHDSRDDRDKSDRDRRHGSDRSDRSDRSRRDRDRRHFRSERTKDRHREERSSRQKDKDRSRSRSRSRSKERAPASFKPLSYREEKGRNKLAQLEKLGIELKAPEGAAAVPTFFKEQNYYNPLTTATAGKYAEQIQKRKLLWANKSKQDESKNITTVGTTNTWVGTTFTHDEDGKMTAKFKRLMGIKNEQPAAPAPGQKPDILKKQEEMFNNMEQQYEVARATTHTQRGVGLGYASSGYQFPR